MRSLQGAFALNRAGVQTASVSQVVSEMTGVAAALLLFADGLTKAFPAPADPEFIAPTYVAQISCTLPEGADAAREVADAVIQTVASVRYVITVDKSGDSMQIGPSNLAVLPKSSCQRLYDEVNGFMEGSFIEVERDFQQKLSKETGLPPLGSCAVICKDSRGWVWIFLADNDDISDKNTKIKQWITDLLAYPS